MAGDFGLLAKRLLATIVDDLIVCVPWLMNPTFGLFLIALYNSCCECTKLEATPGKWLCGLSVTNAQGHGMAFLPSFLRICVQLAVFVLLVQFVEMLNLLILMKDPYGDVQWVLLPASICVYLAYLTLAQNGQSWLDSLYGRRVVVRSLQSAEGAVSPSDDPSDHVSRAGITVAALAMISIVIINLSDAPLRNYIYSRPEVASTLQTVICAKTNLAQGITITNEHLTIMRVPPHDMSSYYVRSPESVIGKILKTNTAAGTIIELQDVVNFNQ